MDLEIAIVAWLELQSVYTVPMCDMDGHLLTWLFPMNTQTCAHNRRRILGQHLDIPSADLIQVDKPYTEKTSIISDSAYQHFIGMVP